MWVFIHPLVLAFGTPSPTPSFSDLATFYGAASVPLAMSFVAIGYLVRALRSVTREKDATIEAMAVAMRAAVVEVSQATGNLAEVSSKWVDTMADANSYLKELRDQGIRNATHGDKQ